MARRWAVGGVAVLAAVPLLLGGCSSAKPASSSLPSSSRASATTSALPPLGPADLPMPAAARTHDSSGVEAFTRYYLDLVNRTSRVMDAAPLRQLSQGCETCDRIATDTEKDAAAGYHYRGGDITITSKSPALVHGGSGEFAFIADQAELVVTDANGQPVPGLSFSHMPKLSAGTAVQWDRDRQSWVMNQLTLG